MLLLVNSCLGVSCVVVLGVFVIICGSGGSRLLDN